MLFICLRMANISSRICRSDSELYGSFGKWNPMVAFLMWLPNGNFHIVYMLILYCVAVARAHTRKICLCLYRQYISYNISFMCVHIVDVCAPMPIQCSYMNDSEDLINERTQRDTCKATCHPMHARVCMWAKRLSSVCETCWALET